MHYFFTISNKNLTSFLESFGLKKKTIAASTDELKNEKINRSKSNPKISDYCVF